jgi:integrase/recombinase XerD
MKKKAPAITDEHAELWAAYAAWITVQNLSAGSAKDHREKVKPFLRFLAAQGLQLAQIDGRTLAAYQVHLFETISPKTGKRLACNSQINRLSALKNFLRFLHATQRIAINPGDAITLPHAPKLLPPVLLKPDEVRRLLDAPDLHNPLGFRDRVILETFYATGLRLSELLSLAVDDLDFEQALVRVVMGKGQRDRLVPMGSVCGEWLRRYVADVRPVLLRGTATPRLFLNRFAQPLDKNGWHKKLDELVKLSRVNAAFTTHGFRHMLATSMLERGADTRHVQEMLGHESLNTTQRYLHVAKGELKKVHAKTHPREAAAKAYGHA